MVINQIKKILIDNLIDVTTSRCIKKDENKFGNKRSIVFSPHFDDETLGCGGAILKRSAEGFDIKIVFMTDGSTSHQKFIPGHKLSEIRKIEGINATQKLGIKRADVTMFMYKEARLIKQKNDAVDRVTKLLKSYEPGEVYVPHSMEPGLWSLDHLATFQIVKQALINANRKLVVYEYPIWLWFHWPWVNFDFKNRFMLNVILKNTLKYRFGYQILKTFNHRVFVGDILERKCEALEQYRTQMYKFVDHKDWNTLPEISNGDFLKCFFRDYEFFNCYTINN